MNFSKSRYNKGVSVISHKGHNITTSVGSDMDSLIENIGSNFTFQVGTIPAEHDCRPDLTSYIFYDTVSYWWFLLQYNNINDPFEGFEAGTNIKIPNL